MEPVSTYMLRTVHGGAEEAATVVREAWPGKETAGEKPGAR